MPILLKLRYRVSSSHWAGAGVKGGYIELVQGSRGTHFSEPLRVEYSELDEVVKGGSMVS